MGSLFGGGSKPTVTPPAPMPDEESPQVLEARRRERERIMSRGGRSSTIMTNPDTRSGSSDSYSGRTLGSGAQ